MNKVLLLVIVLMLSACSSLKFWSNDDNATEANETPVEGSSDGTEGDKDDEREAKTAELPDFKKQIKLARRWRRGIGKGQETYQASLAPKLKADMIFAATREGKVVALEKQNGDILWRVKMDTILTGGVGVGGGLAVVGNNDGEVIALSAESGEELWRTELSGEILAPPGINDSVVVVQTLDAKLVGLSAESGDQLWQYEMDLPVLSLRGTAAPVVTDAMVVSGFANGKVVALEPMTGAVLWDARLAIPKGRTELERMVDVATPLFHNDIVYAVSYQGRAAAYSRGSGRELWGQSYSSHLSPAYGLGQVYVVNDKDRVQALRGSSGQVLWSNNQLSLRDLTSPQVVSGRVAVADAEGYLHLLSQTDGTYLGRTKVDGKGVSVPMASDGDTLYVLDNDGDLTAYYVKETWWFKRSSD